MDLISVSLTDLPLIKSWIIVFYFVKSHAFTIQKHFPVITHDLFCFHLISLSLFYCHYLNDPYLKKTDYVLIFQFHEPNNQNYTNPKNEDITHEIEITETLNIIEIEN